MLSALLWLDISGSLVSCAVSLPCYYFQILCCDGLFCGRWVCLLVRLCSEYVKFQFSWILINFWTQFDRFNVTAEVSNLAQ